MGDPGFNRHPKQASRSQSKRINGQMAREGRVGKSWHGLWKEKSHFTRHFELFTDVTNFSKREIWSPKAFPKDICPLPKLMKKLRCCGTSDPHEGGKREMETSADDSVLLMVKATKANCKDQLWQSLLTLTQQVTGERQRTFIAGKRKELQRGNRLYACTYARTGLGCSWYHSGIAP